MQRSRLSSEISNSLSSPRRSVRERRPTIITDLGYTNKEQLKKAGKGALEVYKYCKKVLGQIKKNPHGKIFIQSVTDSMDLLTVESKLEDGVYTSLSLFTADIRAIWNNAWACNSPGSPIYIATTNISDYFEGLIKEINYVPSNLEAKEEIKILKKQVNKAKEVLKKITGINSLVQRKKHNERQIIAQERAVIAKNIQRLSKERPLEVLRILKEVLNLSAAKNEVEFDLEKLSTRKCKELNQAVKQALSSSNKLKKVKILDDVKEQEVMSSQVRRVNTKEDKKGSISSDSESSFEDDELQEAKQGASISLNSLVDNIPAYGCLSKSSS